MRFPTSPRLPAGTNPVPKKLAARLAQTKWLTLLLVITALAFPALARTPHPFHTSLAEMEWNEKNQSLEVALSVWPVDLETMLKDVPGLAEKVEGPISIDKADQREALEPHIRDYVKKQFQVAKEDGSLLELHWLGFEVERKTVWCYFELKGLNQRSTITFENRLFFEIQADQQNTILYRDGKHRQAIYFVEQQPTHQFDMANIAETAQEQPLIKDAPGR